MERREIASENETAESAGRAVKLCRAESSDGDGEKRESSIRASHTTHRPSFPLGFHSGGSQSLPCATLPVLGYPPLSGVCALTRHRIQTPTPSTAMRTFLSGTLQTPSAMAVHEQEVPKSLCTFCFPHVLYLSSQHKIE